ncbi:GNAT family N-acetyltransferase [Acinetobacter sp. ANC 4173]|uniref:GNAT family N-acetyltransferase n=1 Tax=Acinetobacter sp. ANC 4173 TaxID=2529837 RepID=UPI001038D71B|nr:GNAT family N-acetyltransferase [Acinetobacter sp. ANC 4173]TCB77691.1 GNAT family N-acetyltransferase [Acinetobacter sp. ANC 4173]
MIRAAKIQDIPEIIHVLQESIRSCVQDHHRVESKIQAWLENKTHSHLLLWMHYNDSWIYSINQRTVGFIMVSDTGKILLNYTLPEMQHQGIGSALLNSAISHLKLRNLQQITLDSTQTALSFYQRHGFQIRAYATPEQNTIPMIKYI